MRAARTDKNHAEIRNFLRKAGVLVWDTHDIGGGFPDLLICHHGKLALIEVKDKRGKLTPDQVAFHEFWPVYIVHNKTEAVAVLDKIVSLEYNRLLLERRES